MTKTKLTPLFILVSLLLLALGISACGSASAAASAQPVEVKVTLDSYKIEASLTKFKVGVPYRFVVTNRAQVEHEFHIMPPTSEMSTSEQAQISSLASISSADLAPGATQSVEYTFQQPAAPGELELACHMPGHYEAGMHVSISVEK